jgi:hypothetical protein
MALDGTDLADFQAALAESGAETSAEGAPTETSSEEVDTSTNEPSAKEGEQPAEPEQDSEGAGEKGAQAAPPSVEHLSKLADNLDLEGLAEALGKPRDHFKVDGRRFKSLRKQLDQTRDRAELVLKAKAQLDREASEVAALRGLKTSLERLGLTPEQVAESIKGAQTQAPQAPQPPAPQQAADTSGVERTLALKLSGHPVEKLPGFAREVREHLDSQWDGELGSFRCTVRQAADAVLESHRARAAALGFTAPATAPAPKTKKTPTPRSAPVPQDTPRTEHDDFLDAVREAAKDAGILHKVRA